MLLIVGLGNPGDNYARSRHNAGFMVVEALAEKLRAPSWRSKFHGDFTRCEVADTELMLLRPMTYMNESGRSVRAASMFFRIEPSDIVVVHDELDLPFGELRLKMGGGHAGHNGLRSIFQELGTNDFARLRVGIGRPPRGWSGEVADFVLAQMDGVEREQFRDVVPKAADALRDVAKRGLVAAINALNRKAKPKEPKAEKPTEATETGVENPNEKR